MAVILGIDAAWTPHNASGVALLDTERSVQCLVASSSYAGFTGRTEGDTVDWWTRQSAGLPDMRQLLRAAEQIAGKAVDLIAVDMPVAVVPITGRRAADNAISKEFGGRHCSAHSPSAERPGSISQIVSEDCAELGYPIATAETAPGTPRRLIEVYPHPALLSLLDRKVRVQYKVAKMRKYWPEKTPEYRRVNVMAELRFIQLRLEARLGALPIESAPFNIPYPTAILKRYEDALDAVVSAWVGACYLDCAARPFGDDTAAVWCPV